MESVIETFNNDKLIIRAVDNPGFTRNNGMLVYDCSIIAQEFEMMMSQEGMNSVSSTLLIRNEQIPTYKSVGFLVDARKVNCFHICKSDSGSCGNTLNGDFHANNPDFNTIEELAQYIKKTKSKDMNEVNINLKIDGVIGLVFNESVNSIRSLQTMIIFQKALFKLTGILYPIYMYIRDKGTLQLVELTDEQKYQIMIQNNKYNITSYGYYLESTDDFFINEIFEEKISNKTHH